MTISFCLFVLTLALALGGSYAQFRYRRQRAARRHR